MSGTLSLIDLLAELGAVDCGIRRCDGTLAVVVVALPGKRRLLAIERTYREGICIIRDPTDGEVEIARSGDLWQLWNSQRAVQLVGPAAEESLRDAGTSSDPAFERS